MAVIEEVFRQGNKQKQHQELTDHLENHQTMEPVLLELPDCHWESAAETVVLGKLLISLMDMNRLAELSPDLDVFSIQENTFVTVTIHWQCYLYATALSTDTIFEVAESDL